MTTVATRERAPRAGVMARCARAALVVAALFTSGTVATLGAQGDDTQLWSLNVVQGRFGSRGLWYAEVQPRISDDISRRGQLLLRPAVGLRLNSRVDALFGYAYVRTDPLEARTIKEHRLWQQLQWTAVDRPGGLRIGGRSRLEQRVVEGDHDLGWRLRQQIRAQHPLTRGRGAPSAVLWTEPFLQLDDTRWGARSGFDQWRTFAGIAIPVGDKLTVEPGYMQQRVAQPGRDRINDIVSINLFLRF